MKNKIKKLVTICILFVMVAGVLPVSQVQAATKLEKEITYYLYKDKTKNRPAMLSINAHSGKITNLKNSDSSVAKVSVYNNIKYLLNVEPKSEGTTKVGFRYNGKKYTTKLIVRKWENPCKVLKVGSKNYAKNFDKSEQYSLHRQKSDLNAKIQIVPKKGWKLSGIKRVTNASTKKVKNNSTVNLSISDTGTGLMVNFKNTKTKEERCIYLGYSDFNIPIGNTYNVKAYDFDLW